MNKYDASIVFKAIVESGSLVAAARHLNQSASAISKQIAYLEIQLGTQLLERTTRRIKITEAGKLFYQKFRQINAHWDNLLEETSEVAAAPQGTLHIAAPAPLCNRLLAPVTAEFQAIHPDIRIILQAEHYDKLPCDLADISIGRKITAFNSANYIGAKICDYHNHLYASPGYLASGKKLRTVKDLSDHPCLYYGLQADAGNWQFKGNKQKTVSGSLHTNNTDTMIGWAVAGLGISQLPPLLIQPELQRGELVRVLPQLEGITTSAWAYYQKLDFPAKKVRLFIDFLKSSPHLKE